MKTFAIIALSVLLACAEALGQADTIGRPRMRGIAQQTQPPGTLSAPYAQILDTVADAIDHSTLNVAADRFTRFLEHERDSGRKGISSGYVNYVLHRAAVAGSQDAAAASAQAAYFLAQENAILEHLSLLEKQYSDRAGSRLPDFVLREPVLGEFGQDDDAVRRGLPQNVNTNDVPQRIGAWRDALDRVERQRLDAVTAFDAAVRADPRLQQRLIEADARLAEVVRNVFGESDG